MKAIGGYPELELRKGDHYHKEAIRLNTARNCLEYILLARQYRKVYLPIYTCEAVFEPFTKKALNGIETEFYYINERFEPLHYPDLNNGEAFLYTNYFGLMQDEVDKLVRLYGNQLIIDNSQAFFDPPHKGIDTFYSARKFFGVPDGAYLYTDLILSNYEDFGIEEDYSFDRMTALLKRIDFGAEAGYADFREIEEKLCFQPIRKMSGLTTAILSSIDYEEVKKRRRENYKTLYWKLYQRNGLWIKLHETAVPLCYPFLAKSPELRKKMIANKIFVPTYWPNVFQFCSESSVEYTFAEKLMPLPIDQRYDSVDMDRIWSLILKL